MEGENAKHKQPNWNNRNNCGKRTWKQTNKYKDTAVYRSRKILQPLS